MRLVSFALGALALLSACTEPMTVNTAPQDVTWKSKSASRDVVAQDLVTVRTFVKRDNGGTREVRGASCQIEAAQYTAHFQTPGTVSVPYKGREKSPSATLACEFQGKTGQQTLAVRDLTGDERAKRVRRNSVFFGMTGLVVGQVVASKAAKEREGDSFGYPPDVRLTLRDDQ